MSIVHTFALIAAILVSPDAVKVSSSGYTHDSNGPLLRVRHYQGEVKLSGPGDRLVVSATNCRKIYLNKTGYGGPAPILTVINPDGDVLFEGRIEGTYRGQRPWGPVTVIVSYPGKKPKGRCDSYLHVES